MCREHDIVPLQASPGYGGPLPLRVGEQDHVFTSVDGLTYAGSDTLMTNVGGEATTWTYQWDFHGGT